MKHQHPHLLFATADGRIFDDPAYSACGTEGGIVTPLTAADLTPLPDGSKVFMLPDRPPIGYDRTRGTFDVLTHRPGASTGQKAFAVAAFLQPGYTATHTSAYHSDDRHQRPLPLYAYTAAAFYRGRLYAAALQVDREKRHDSRHINMQKVRARAGNLLKSFPRNRLIGHLARCATRYGCAGAQNFFLGLYEGPLPTSPHCNARCCGCISYQKGKAVPAAQPRIAFVPRPEEIAETALFHLSNVPDAVVSFGQGCEGEPLLAARIIEEAIRLIRQKTPRGLINMNTNGSKPAVLARLFDAGLGSIRVSLNSARAPYYTRYYRPAGYRFNDVLRSIALAKRRGVFVSLNYLTMPGFTDTHNEYTAIRRLIATTRADMIQWRNLNYDPCHYFALMRYAPAARDLIGIRHLIRRLRNEFPHLMTGYYNPSPAQIARLRKGAREERKPA